MNRPDSVTFVWRNKLAEYNLHTKSFKFDYFNIGLVNWDASPKEAIAMAKWISICCKHKAGVRPLDREPYSAQKEPYDWEVYKGPYTVEKF